MRPGHPSRKSKKRADSIKEGDKLWSRSEFDPHGPIELKEVEEVFVRVAPIWNAHVAGQIIRTTAEHPFWVVGRGWIATHDLRIRDLVSTRNGLVVPIEGVAKSGQIETVYNWRVADYHTYFVSATDAGVSIWAHNAYTGAKRGPKTDNRFGHNRKIREVAREVTAKGERVIAGGRKFDGKKRKEAVIDTPGGFKSKRRPDLLVERADGSIYGINVGRRMPSGRPVRRERRAIQDLNEQAGLEMLFIPYGR